jgi:hypothetical protein
MAVSGDRVQITLDEGWLGEHPLTALALEQEEKEWKELGVRLSVTPVRTRDPIPALLNR